MNTSSSSASSHFSPTSNSSNFFHPTTSPLNVITSSYASSHPTYWSTANPYAQTSQLNTHSNRHYSNYAVAAAAAAAQYPNTFHTLNVASPSQH